MSIDDHQDALELVRNQMKDLGAEFHSETTFEFSERPDAPAIFFERTGYTIGVAAYKDREFFQVYYPYSVAQSLAQNLPTESIEQIIDNQDIEGESEDEEYEEAAKYLLEALDEDDMRRFRYRLSDKISTSGNTLYGFYDTDGDALFRYEVTSKIFPYEDGYSLSDLEEQVRSVMSDGVRGHQFVKNTFDIDDNGKGGATAEFKPDLI